MYQATSSVTEDDGGVSETQSGKGPRWAGGCPVTKVSPSKYEVTNHQLIRSPTTNNIYRLAQHNPILSRLDQEVAPSV